MSIAEEIRKLQELHQAGALTDAEFAQAKARVLTGQAAEPQDEALRDQLAEMRRQHALDRLDRAWDRERERYMVTSRYGNRYTPSKTGSIIMGAGIVGFGAVWIVMAASFGAGFGGAGGLFPLFGVVFMLVGLAVTAFSFMRASQYDRAYQRYQHQRALLLSGDDDDEADDDVIDETPLQHRASTAIQDLAEPAPCLKCGRTIPAGQAECPHCGWTYE